MAYLIIARNVVLVVAPIIFITGQRTLPWSYLFSLDNQFFILYWLWIPSALWWLIGKDENSSDPKSSYEKEVKDAEAMDYFLKKGWKWVVFLISIPFLYAGFVYLVVTFG